MRLTFRTDRPWFTIVTTLRRFKVQARDLVEAKATAPGIIIACVETIVEITE